MTLQVPEYNPLTDQWDTLIGEADQVIGAEHITDEALDKLMKVPFVITNVTYRDGTKRMGSDYRDDYVSCKAVVAPETELAKRVRMGRLNLADISVEPGEHIIFNDGSTGIYRQITQYLHVKEYITLPEPLTAGNQGKGNSSFDLPRSEWVAGADQAGIGISIRLYCPRGLRYSEYTNDYAPDGAKTRYIG
jgi:hypothetical protein